MIFHYRFDFDDLLEGEDYNYEVHRFGKCLQAFLLLHPHFKGRSKIDVLKSREFYEFAHSRYRKQAYRAFKRDPDVRRAATEEFENRSYNNPCVRD